MGTKKSKKIEITKTVNKAVKTAKNNAVKANDFALKTKFVISCFHYRV